ncbi:MAG: universal stress protein [Rhodobacteraceae bacterium]|nr:universal stress protein [Paracoccaceae bacterium]
MTHSILVATDGSETGARAIDCAVELAASLGAPLLIIHVSTNERPSEGLRQYAETEHLVDPGPLPPPSSADPHEALPLDYWEGLAPDEAESGARDWLSVAVGEDIVRRAVDCARAGGVSDVRSEVLEGEPAGAIIDHALSRGADMIVLGSRGLGALRGVLQGSVSRKVVHHAPCTVVVVR